MRQSQVLRSPNKLLASLPVEDYQRIAPSLSTVPMKLKQVVHRQDEPIEYVYFPGGGAFSLVRTLQDGQVAEVATVGAEGAVGAGVFFGQRVADCDVLVQLTGPGAQAMTTERFNAEMERRGALYNCVVRYNQALTTQIMQSTACNGLHSAEQRCCRWLLMTHDRAGADEFRLTHEFLATMLGVRRPTVTLVANALQNAGLIQYRRGSVKIVDRARLEAASCECYATVRNQMRRLLPDLQAPLKGESAQGATAR
jgi:CRP-like cAMP-binding protein